MVNPATFFVVALLVFQFTHAKDISLFSFYVFVDGIAFALLANSGYFIKIGSLSLECEEVFMTFFIVMFFASGGMKSVRTSLVMKATFLLLVVTIGLYLLAVDPVNVLVMPIGGSWDLYYAGSPILEPLAFSTRNVQRLFRLLLFIVTVIELNNLSKKMDLRSVLIKCFVSITIVQTAIGYLDLSTKVLFHRPILQLVAGTFFGQASSQFQGLGVRAGAYFIQGFMKEPSHFAVSMIPGLTILALSRNKSTWTRFLEVASVAILILSTSFAGFGIAFYWFALKLLKFVFESRLPKIFSILIVLGGMVFVVSLVSFFSDLFPLLQYNLSRFSGLIGIGPKVGSEASRLLSVKSSFENFIERPFFGIGLGSTNAHGFIPSLLSNMGFIGFIAWIAFVCDGFGIRRATLVPLIFWLLLVFLTGDIGWLYNMMGIAMLIGVASCSYQDYKQKEYLVNEQSQRN